MRGQLKAGRNFYTESKRKGMKTPKSWGYQKQIQEGRTEDMDMVRNECVKGWSLLSGDRHKKYTIKGVYNMVTIVNNTVLYTVDPWTTWALTFHEVENPHITL